jgi:hypothetical protein
MHQQSTQNSFLVHQQNVIRILPNPAVADSFSLL